MLLEKMTSTERYAVGSLAAIMSLRLLGLFMILPVFALYALQLTGSTPFLIGVAIGVYGLTQALFQIPFGMLSDHIGRKPVILFGLLIFIAGSILSALSQHIGTMIIGRALQGAGAVGSTIIAMLTDFTRVEQRSKAMAINGITIGFSFSLAMVLGPVFAAWVQVNGIFWLAAGLGALGIVILFMLVPASSWHSDTEPAPAQFFTLLKEPQLLRLNLGVLILHAIFTASFVVIPIALDKLAGISGKTQWTLYLPALAAAFVISLALIAVAEKNQRVKPFFIAGIVMLGLAECFLLIWAHNKWLSGAAIVLFFTAFSLLEAFLPSWVSRVAPVARKGTALGIYSCSQFLGIFVGGTLGGWLYGSISLLYVYLFCVILTLIWLPIASGMKSPLYSAPPRLSKPVRETNQMNLTT
jgi:MFS family permease